MDARCGFFGVRPARNRIIVARMGPLQHNFGQRIGKSNVLMLRGMEDTGPKPVPRLLVGRWQVEIHVVLAIQPVRKGAVYRVERRLPLFVLQRDEVERATRHPIRFGRT